MKVMPAAPQPNNYIIVVFDSCRNDSFVAAKPKTILGLGELEARWSYASWTAPSHYNLLSGSAAARQPCKQVFASEYYKKDFPEVRRSGWASKGVVSSNR